VKTGRFPGRDWERAKPAEAGMDPARLEQAVTLFDEQTGAKGGRLVVVRSGRVVLEHDRHMESDPKLPIASAAKSVYACVLGAVIAEGKLASADERVLDYYPEMMDVADGQGNKPGRYAFEANRAITFRHLICNVSGYMKPGEAPGQVFNYQTWGMNILTHALAKIYGLYDANDPEGAPGFKRLIEEKIAGPIGADWDYEYMLTRTAKLSDRLHAGARLDVFGYYTQVRTTPLDLARFGWLCCNWGRWSDTQVVPEQWMREITVTAPDILANCPEAEWMYGHGIWTNDQGKIWPNLPREAFTANGAGGHYATVFPSSKLVVVQSPGRLRGGGDRSQLANPDLLERILTAVEEEVPA